MSKRNVNRRVRVGGSKRPGPVIVYGDVFAGDSPRMRQLKAKALVELATVAPSPVEFLQRNDIAPTRDDAAKLMQDNLDDYARLVAMVRALNAPSAPTPKRSWWCRLIGWLRS